MEGVIGMNPHQDVSVGGHEGTRDVEHALAFEDNGTDVHGAGAHTRPLFCST